MRHLFFMLLIGCLANTALADEPPADSTSPDKVESIAEGESVWMRKKMEYSQAILKGMATGDFEAIQLNASRMRLLNKVEGFVRKRNPSYRWHIRVFERTTSQLADHAKAENLPGVTLAFNQLVVNCVNCHNSIRNETATDVSK